MLEYSGVRGCCAGRLAPARAQYPTKPVPCDVLDDFDSISLLAIPPSFVSGHPSVPVRSVRELIRLAKARPGALNYGSAGVGTNPHISGELFAGSGLPAVNLSPGSRSLRRKARRAISSLSGASTCGRR